MWENDMDKTSVDRVGYFVPRKAVRTSFLEDNVVEPTTIHFYFYFYFGASKFQAYSLARNP